MYQNVYANKNITKLNKKNITFMFCYPLLSTHIAETYNNA